MADDGRGKYDDEAEFLLRKHGSTVVIITVIGGDRGNSFSVASLDPETDMKLPSMLRHMADQIEAKARLS